MTPPPRRRNRIMLQPVVPTWIRSFAPPPGWTNVFALVPSNTHLYGTETLFGDWDGKTLLLAKDGAPTPVIRALRDKGDPRPWRHAQRELGDPGGYKTNDSLAAAASALPGGKLYGSATANLLLDDPRWSRSLPGFHSGPLHEYLKRVLTWVIDSMPNLEQIACLGQESWFLTCVTLGRPDLARQFSHHRDTHQPLTAIHAGKPITAFALYHPAARVSDEAKRRGWVAMTGRAPPQVSTLRDGRQPMAAATVLKPATPVQGASTWTDAPFTRTGSATPVRDSPIRAEMVTILKKAGPTGVPWTAFQSLAWQPPFTAGKLYKAMALLANKNCYHLQYQGRRSGNVFPTRWRIVP